MKYRLLLGLLSLSGAIMAQDDPVLFTVGDMAVKRSEFEQSYLKNNTLSGVDRKTFAEYLDLYIDYKLKVKAALNAHIDTTADFRREWAYYLGGATAANHATAQPQAVQDMASADNYATACTVNGGESLMRPAQILLRVRQKACGDEQRQAQQRIDSIYQALLRGADFATMARRYSQDEASAALGGDMGWIGRAQLLREVEAEADKLMPGDMTRPFQSMIGYHILLMQDRCSAGDIGELQQAREEVQQRRALRQQASQFPVEGVMLETTASADAPTVTMPAEGQQREVYEGLLLIEQSKHSVWRQAANDEQALERYFKKHKKQYRRKGFKPKSYSDVRELVTTDLQSELERHWLADLHSRYPVSVNKDAMRR